MRVVINIKTEKEVKARAQKLAKEIGLSLSAVINAYLKQFVRNKEVHFSITPKMSPELEKLLGKIEFDIQRNRNISGDFSSKKEFKKHLTS
ncbi:type II toxin-antitoxin system RelB/DinJ family antitoxin [Patescibacteria group bacterium]|nr:type II toxin-antitoxin system RelB/DinJ family antitoxin [Patescibacteria group bacterium]